MISDKFRKLLRDESKLKEAKKICENAGFKVRSKTINESHVNIKKDHDVAWLSVKTYLPINSREKYIFSHENETEVDILVSVTEDDINSNSWVKIDSNENNIPIFVDVKGYAPSTSKNH